MAAATVKTESYNRAKDVKDFDDSKMGVKGLVDSGITNIPRFFVQPAKELSDLIPNSTTQPNSLLIPTVDLSGVDSDYRPIVVENIARASRELGFFQIINHVIEVESMERVIGAIKGFHEQPADIKARLYTRDKNRSVAFHYNVDLLHSEAASWSDTLRITLGPTMPELDEIPKICRNEVVEWNGNVNKLGELLMELLCEDLGVEKEKLKKNLERRLMVAHYYSYCPQPDLTFGIVSHTDPGALTILLQDQIGGLQIISNDVYKSIEHRVLANPFQEPRISAAVFFGPENWDDMYGPLTELVSPETPPQYRQFTYTEYMTRFFTKGLDGKSLLDYCRLLDAE